MPLILLAIIEGYYFIIMWKRIFSDKIGKVKVNGNINLLNNCIHILIWILKYSLLNGTDFIYGFYTTNGRENTYPIQIVYNLSIP